MSLAALAMLVALALDALIGWPPALFRRIGHPVTWLGALIARLDRAWNHPGLNARGALARGAVTVLAVVAAAALPAWALSRLLPTGVAGAVLTGVLAWPLVAARSLHEHVADVARPLLSGELPAARSAVSMIVGRDPERLDEAGIVRAALESLAENSSDGVMAPLFWGLLLGLPGIATYKALNTLDSMIGHRSERHLHFGRVAARLDDAANLIPARLTGTLLALTSPAPRAAFAAMGRDARHHRSPNAGWPEAAMAGGLGIRLSGPRIYAEGVANEPWLNGAAPDPVPEDLSRGLALYARAMGVLALLLAAWSAPLFL